MMCSVTRLIRIHIFENAVGKVSSRPLLGIVRNVVEPPRRWAGTDVEIEKLDGLDLLPEEPSVDESKLEKIRDISRLRRPDRNRVNNMMPHPEPVIPAHYTVRWNRRMLGRYGAVSGVNPGVCWPTKVDLEDMKEYERVAYPYTIPEIVEREAAKEAAVQKRIRDWDEEVARRVAELPKLKAQLEERKAKAQKELEDAQAKRKYLIELVDQHFNYAVHHSDERFRDEMQRRRDEMKEKEKAAKKEAKKKRDEEFRQKKFELLKESFKKPAGSESETAETMSDSSDSSVEDKKQVQKDE